MPAKKPPAKKTTAKKPAAKKAPAKKTAAKKPPAKKTATATKETKPKEAVSSNGTIAVEDEISKSFLDYAMSVIVSRALPDVKDGLKPVQRRILYSMYETGIRPTGPFRKCSKVVGDVMGNYHPHGNEAIYGTLVRLGQHFSTVPTNRASRKFWYPRRSSSCNEVHRISNVFTLISTSRRH